MNKYIGTLILLVLCSFSHDIISEEKKETLPKVSYFTLKEEIVTNYLTKGAKLGFINIKVDLMVTDKSILKTVEYHQPLIRDTIISIVSRENEQRIKSLEGREALRQACLAEVNEALLSEVESTKDIISDLLFTKYLYQ